MLTYSYYLILIVTNTFILFDIYDRILIHTKRKIRKSIVQQRIQKTSGLFYMRTDCTLCATGYKPRVRRHSLLSFKILTHFHFTLRTKTVLCIEIAATFKQLVVKECFKMKFILTVLFSSLNCDPLT